MDELFEDLVSTVKKHKKNLNLNQLKKAYLFAKEAHGDQMRHSGEPYVVHPVNVAKILIELGMDVQTIVAAILHDVLEDTQVSYDDVKKNFSEEVAYLVNGVTKLSTMKYGSKEENQAENIRKMFMAMAEDHRVIIIKLADRLHNMRTIKFVREEKQLEKARETMEIYAPLAHRFGIRGIKEELEDLSVKVLDPYACEQIGEYLAINKKARQTLLDNIKKKIEDRLLGENIKSTIDARVKSIYGIYKKVYEGDRQFEEVYDVYAIRIILDAELACYNILGIIHDMFTPIPSRFKDYISTPKSNMYQSLHTTVVEDSVPVEIQIRTWKMHRTAEYGIAAHWKYKVGLTGMKKDEFEKSFEWVRRFLERQQNSDGDEELISSIKSDFIPDEIFVFTPKGDVKSLPKGATVIDFAYSIHTDVGNHTVGAKVDGRMVSLDHVVKTGEVIEVITNEKSKGPSKNWLRIAKSSEAKSKIKNWFKTVDREENIAEGKHEFARELKKNLVTLTGEQMESFVAEVAAHNKFKTNDEFYAALGYGGISLFKIMPGVKELFQKKHRNFDRTRVIEDSELPVKARRGKCVVIENIEDCLVNFAKCCDPMPGDEIIGFVTRGHGVSVHKKDCKNAGLCENVEQRARWVSAKWYSGEIKGKFSTGIEVLSHSRPEALASVVSQLTSFRLLIRSVVAKEIEGHRTLMRFSTSIGGLTQLNKVISEIMALPGVISAKRILSNSVNEKK
ncbi:MAG: bifunctional (p)ppGpp synthetase/guanosine-3',5'-bis(diphosphate) 3'-pyrophosphohydrolase [Oscillospiraceae bacterium]|nr:bifunctional (p)ppGpp synthetase/guanosine-3',5'-bis(diphosphate) 3'-pyrophosphohydrolase [Oscillospiraceae bacterium]